jgi:hypothetical protein
MRPALPSAPGGPNTNGGEIISALQRQAEFAVRSINRPRDDSVERIEVRPWFYRRYNQCIQSFMATTSWIQSNNYYKSPSGRVVTNGLMAQSVIGR